jgi:hypothetical protein
MGSTVLIVTVQVSTVQNYFMNVPTIDAQLLKGWATLKFVANFKY